MRARLVIGMIVAVLVVAAVAIAVPLSKSYFDKRDVATKVISKERVCNSSNNGNQSCEYLVFTEAGTFKIVDALFGTVRFNSSDVYGRLREDRCYRFRVYGWRFGPLSMYPNVADVAEIPCKGA